MWPLVDCNATVNGPTPMHLWAALIGLRVLRGGLEIGRERDLEIGCGEHVGGIWEWLERILEVDMIKINCICA